MKKKKKRRKWKEEEDEENIDSIMLDRFRGEHNFVSVTMYVYYVEASRKWNEKVSWKEMDSIRSNSVAVLPDAGET